MLKRQCAWCQRDMEIKPGVSGTTHGICKRCFFIEVFKIRMAVIGRLICSWLPTAAFLVLFAIVCAMLPSVMAWEDKRAQQKAVARVVYAVMVEE